MTAEKKRRRKASSLPPTASLLLARAWEFLADVSVRDYFAGDQTYEKLLADLDRYLE